MRFGVQKLISENWEPAKRPKPQDSDNAHKL